MPSASSPTPDDLPLSPPPLPTCAGSIDRCVRTIVVFGGTFDPPHKGHVQLPLLAVSHLERTRAESRGVHLLYVPAARSPHKQRGPEATDAQRLAMLKLATEHLPRCAVWTEELDRARAHGGGPSYTIDTVRRLRTWLDVHGGQEVVLRLLIGEDQALVFDRWRSADELALLARPLVLARPVPGMGLNKSIRLGPSLGAPLAEVVPMGAMGISSTQVRRECALLSDDSPVNVNRYLDPQVLAYIRAQGLYTKTGA